MIKASPLSINVINPNMIEKMPCPNEPIIYNDFAPIFVPIFPMIGDEIMAAKKAIPNEKPYCEKNILEIFWII